MTAFINLVGLLLMNDKAVALALWYVSLILVEIWYLDLQR